MNFTNEDIVIPEPIIDNSPYLYFKSLSNGSTFYYINDGVGTVTLINNGTLANSVYGK